MAEPTPEGTEPQLAEERTSHGVLATVLLIAFVIILMLLFWRSCSASGDEGSATRGDATIQELDDLEPAPGGVAVWIRPDASIEPVLVRNGLSGAPIANMGEGTYVIGIGDVDAERMVEQLADDPDLYDAGFVYLEE